MIGGLFLFCFLFGGHFPQSGTEDFLLLLLLLGHGLPPTLIDLRTPLGAPATVTAQSPS